MRTVILLLLAIAAIEARTIFDKSCEVSIDYLKGDLKEPQPLILEDKAEPTFLLPNEKKLLRIPFNSSILLACPGRNNGLKNLDSKQYATALCLSGKQFLVNGETHEFRSFACKVLPKETVRKSSSKCLEHHQKYEIGFYVQESFLTLLEICRDEWTLRSYYSKMTIPKTIFGFQSSYPRPYWKFGSFYPGYSMNAIYKAEAQLRSLELLLGSAELAERYVRPGEQQFLNRGHLAAKADFVYGSQQSATFWHLNTAPQWASFNSGNWMIAERNVRDLAGRRGIDLVVYTGVHGVASLEDVNGNQQPLYLHVNETHKAFPVPRFYWKLVHEPASNRALALVGLNEPYASNITKDMYLCEDIAGDLSWLTWEPDSIERGISYACTAEALRKAVPTVPLVGEQGVLL